jgi:hypothetical protein
MVVQGESLSDVKVVRHRVAQRPASAELRSVAEQIRLTQG